MSVGVLAAVAGVTLLAAAFHVLGQPQRPLWLDEACTYLVVQSGILDILRGTRTDGMPPLYFLLVSLATRMFGQGEIALRLPSIVAAVALVPALYLLTRRLAGGRAGLIAAGLAAISPLVHHYAVEARYYALVQLETVAVVYAMMRALDAPHVARWWALLALAQALQFWTHASAIFLLPVPAAIGLLVGGTSRVALALKAAATSVLALVVCLPWFLRAVDVGRRGGTEWLVGYWEETPPYAAILRSLEAFGFGGAYPMNLPGLALGPSLRVPSLIVSLGLLAIAALPWADRRPREVSRSTTYALLVFLFVPLLGQWLYSLVWRPMYLVGRYDTIALPAFLVLLALGLDKVFRVRPWAGVIVTGAILGLATLSSSAALRGNVFIPHESLVDVATARHLAQHAAPSDPVVATGFRRPGVVYYLDRGGHRRNLRSFPPEIGEHPGWYSTPHLLSDRARLAREGEDVARELVAAAREGRRVWVLMSQFTEVDEHLYRPLRRELVIDGARSRQDLGLLCLRPA